MLFSTSYFTSKFLGGVCPRFFSWGNHDISFLLYHVLHNFANFIISYLLLSTKAIPQDQSQGGKAYFCFFSSRKRIVKYNTMSTSIWKKYIHMLASLNAIAIKAKCPAIIPIITLTANLRNFIPITSKIFWGACAPRFFSWGNHDISFLLYHILHNFANFIIPINPIYIF